MSFDNLHFRTRPRVFKETCVSRKALLLLVDVGVVFPLARKPKHATDDAGVFHGPVLVADLLPGPLVLHLHVSLGDGHPLAVGGEDGPDPYVLHLDVHVLQAQRNADYSGLQGNWLCSFETGN